MKRGAASVAAATAGAIAAHAERAAALDARVLAIVKSAGAAGAAAQVIAAEAGITLAAARGGPLPRLRKAGAVELSGVGGWRWYECGLGPTPRSAKARAEVRRERRVEIERLARESGATGIRSAAIAEALGLSSQALSDTGLLSQLVRAGTLIFRHVGSVRAYFHTDVVGPNFERADTRAIEAAEDAHIDPPIARRRIPALGAPPITTTGARSVFDLCAPPIVTTGLRSVSEPGGIA